MERFIHIIMTRYKLVIIVTLLFTITFGYLNTKISINNTVDIYFEEQDPLVKVYQSFKEIFGNEEAVVILFKDDHIFSNEKITIIRNISDMAKDMTYVHRVFSLTEQDEAITENDALVTRKIIPDGLLDKNTLEEIHQRVLKNNILLNRMISKDGKTVAIIIELETIGDSKEKSLFIQQLKDAAIQIAGNKVDLHFTGLPILESEQNILMIKDFLTITPLVFFIIIIILQVNLKRMALNVLSLLTLTITTILAVGFFVLYGESVNMVTAVMPAVLLAISVADTIHLLSHYKDEIAEGKSHIAAVKNATNAIWLPCLFTSLTTAVGFFSFITATIRPVKTLGLFTAMGVMTAFILTVTFLPAALILFRKRFETPTTLSPTLNNPGLILGIVLKMGTFSTTYIKTIGLVFIGLIVVMGIGVSKIKFETNVFNFFDEDTKMIQDFKFIEDNLGGAFNSELLITAKAAEHDFTHPESLRLIEKVQTSFISSEGEREISSSLSIVDYVKEINKAFNNNDDTYYRLPDTRMDVMDYLELGNDDDVDRLLSPDGMQARVSYQTYSETFEKVKNQISDFKAFLRKTFGSNYSYDLTGSGILWMSMEGNLKASFVKSFLFAFVIIFMMMIYVCKDIKLAALSMVPNLFPIFLTIGIMGWFDIPFNTLTVTIACVTLGIAVDDTVHYLVWFKRNIESGLDTRTALISTFQDVGKPIVITTLILAITFFTLVLGSYRPMNTFGSLTALTILFALIADLIILPALILVFEPFAKKQVQSENMETA